MPDLTNWYRRDLPEKKKALERAEREYKMASLALSKAQAELAYRKAELEHYQVMADVTDEEDKEREEERLRWAKEAKPLVKAVA
jgi:hypothetical protein